MKSTKRAEEALEESSSAVSRNGVTVKAKTVRANFNLRRLWVIVLTRPRRNGLDRMRHAL